MMPVEVYEVNEIVMCKDKAWHTFAYMAKVVEVQPDDHGHLKYRIHYQGWNSRYDKWIEHPRVEAMMCKHTPEVEAEHAQLLKEASAKPEKKTAPVEAAGATAVVKKTEKKSKKNEEMEKEDKDDTAAKKEKRAERKVLKESNQEEEEEEEDNDDDDLTAVNVPEELLALLAVDKEHVSEKRQLVKLPATVTVDDVIKEYGDAVMSRAHGDELMENYVVKRRIQLKDLVVNKRDNVETSKTVSQYFNILLGSQLLYATEREQYKQACINPADDAPGTKNEMKELYDIKILPSSIYGLPHLIRLFMRIGPLVEAKYGGKSLLNINRQLNHILRFICEHKDRFHNPEADYEASTDQEDARLDAEDIE